jgi:hypothetical protein
VLPDTDGGQNQRPGVCSGALRLKMLGVCKDRGIEVGSFQEEQDFLPLPGQMLARKGHREFDVLADLSDQAAGGSDHT